MKLSYIDLQKSLRSVADFPRADFLMRFFKTGKGQYAEGDKFLGMTVPLVRKIVRPYKTLPITEVEELLNSPWHEERFSALIIMIAQFKNGTPRVQKQIFNMYLANTKNVNNWDLVDVSAEHIVGQYLANKPKQILYKLAKSKKLFERRIAIVSTFHYIKLGNLKDTFKISDILLNDKEDLIQKAVGWMLREAGKRVSKSELVLYLAPRYKRMPRTMLRYSIERFLPEERKRYLKGEV